MKFLGDMRVRTNMYDCQYYESKLDKWITYYKAKTKEEASVHLGDPIVGSPTTRFVEVKRNARKK